MSVFARHVAVYGYSVIEIKEPAHLAAMKRYIHDHLRMVSSESFMVGIRRGCWTDARCHQ